MNFWEEQRKARHKTKLYLALFAFLTLAVAVGIELALREIAQEQYHPPYPMLALGFAGITFGVAGYQYLMFRSYGGSYVAESMGAHLVDKTTTDPKEIMLLNIVEEIAVASSLPVPPIYLMDSKQINAFAAGLTADNAAIAITRGALEKLNRDEVQGVIAHEYGHIFNGDMKISMRLAAMVMGFFFVLYFALRMLQFSSFRSNRSSKKGGNPIVLAALFLLLAGAFTWFFGSILKASVSRQREFLADACAVQFTRNPDGIANALKKIGEDHTSDMPKEGIAFNHMYLDNHSGFSALFATHPPLEKRIKAILGKEYLPEEWKKEL